MNIQEENLFCVSLASQFWVMAGIWRLINSYGQTALHSQCLSLVSVALSNKECTLPYHQLSEVFTPVKYGHLAIASTFLWAMKTALKHPC